MEFTDISVLKNLNPEICSPNFSGQIIIYFMVIFVVPDQINQIICLFQMLAVNYESILHFKSFFFFLSLKVHFKKEKKNTQIHDLSFWQLQRDNSNFFPYISYLQA